jgi:hypothetical protein
MEQLAGIAGDIAQTARAFGEARAAEEAPEKAQAAVEQAIQTDPETGEVTFGELPKAKGYGASATNKIALTIYDSSKEIYLDQQLDKFEEEHPNDLQLFTEKSQALYNELIQNASPESQARLAKEYSARFRTSAKSIQKTVDLEVKEAGKASYVILLDQYTKAMTKAYQENDVEAEKMLSENFAATIKDYVKNGIVKLEQVEKDGLKIANQKNIISFKARINNIVDDDDLDIDERTQVFNEVEDNLSEIIKDFSPQDQETARNYLKTQKSSAFSRDKRLLQEANIASLKTQLENFNNLRIAITSDELAGNFAEKTRIVREARLMQQIDDTQESALINFINSDKALNASNNDTFINNTIIKVYDLLELPEDELFLTGIKNIENDLLFAAANGQIEQNEYRRVSNQIANLTNKRKAEAGYELTYGFSIANDLIDLYLPNSPEQKGTIMRGLFLEAEPEIERLRQLEIEKINANRKEPMSKALEDDVKLPNNIKEEVYRQYISQAIAAIQQQRFDQVNQIVIENAKKNSE